MGNINLEQTSFAGIASALGVLYLTGATYDDMQDFINTTMSSGRISGGLISDDGDGTITVATGTGFIKSNAASAIEETYFFDWPQSVVVPLVDGSVNYIYVEYNAGTPRAWSTITRSNIRLTDQFTLGRVYKDGGTLHIVNSGVDLANHIRLNYERLVACRWVEQASGGMVSEPAALKLKTTAGVFYVGSSKITTAGKDTSVADTFDSWYRDGVGGWNNELGETDVNNTEYDDGSGVLAGLPGASKYSARYVYIDFDGHIMVQYGQQANAKLSVIQAEEVPAPPPFLNEFAILAARVIIRDGDSPLVEIAGAYVEMFAYQGITRHDDLAGVTSDQHHAQLHAAEHEVGGGDLLAFANIPDFGDWLDQAVKIGSSPTHVKITLSNGQVVFPAAQVASADPNTLDDYEEGTFTPYIYDAFTGGNQGGVGSGFYTKIGNLVNVYISFLNVSTAGMTGANQLYIRELPFTVKSGTSPVGAIRSTRIVINNKNLIIVAESNSKRCAIHDIESNADGAWLIVSALQSGAADFQISMNYQV